MEQTKKVGRPKIERPKGFYKDRQRIKKNTPLIEAAESIAEKIIGVKYEYSGDRLQTERQTKIILFDWLVLISKTQ